MVALAIGTIVTFGCGGTERAAISPTIEYIMPTATAVPPTATPIPPTATPIPTVVETPTAAPTATPAPLRVAAQAVNPPAPLPESTTDVRRWSWDEIVSALAQYDWPLEGAIATIMCESGGNQFARNSSGARGLFQDINGDAGLDDPAISIPRGYAKWAPTRSFYQHWTQWGGCGAGW